MMALLSFLVFFLASTQAFAMDVFNLNVFDQLQGDWKPGFRERRMEMIADYVRKHAPGIVVFEETQGAGQDSGDTKLLSSLYPHRKYVHEMTGKDGASYGYWIGAKKKPRNWIEDGFSFPGGVERKVLGGIWDLKNGKQECLGVIGLHLSYQNSEVRQKEAAWLLEWVKRHEADCPRWLVVGDFNADEKSKEMQMLFEGGLKSLYKELKPTVGAFNPIRRIYGNDIPSLTIDWALGWNLDAGAEVVLDKAVVGDEWVSDHAGVLVKLK